MKRVCTLIALVGLSFFTQQSFSEGEAALSSRVTPLSAVESADVMVLMNDSFKEEGGEAFLQMGFIKQEMAGVFVKVPDQVKKFKVDYFRILIGSSQNAKASKNDVRQNIFFRMGAAANLSSPVVGNDIENAADVTPGPYWNDIPAQGDSGNGLCVDGGQYIGAAIEFTHDGLPSIYRDMDGLNMRNNSLFTADRGWSYSAVYGLRGDWVLRVVGHEAVNGDCP